MGPQTTHVHTAHYATAWRLTLAHLGDSSPAGHGLLQLISDEIGDCASCWRTVALQLAAHFAGETVWAQGGTDNAVECVEAMLAEILLGRQPVQRENVGKGS